MTREEAILWLNEELRTWENECQSKHPIKEALYEACKALERELNTWSLDDAREDFMHDVYNILDFLPTNDEANRIIDSFDMVTKCIKQEPRWIPVTERLPEEMFGCLVTVWDASPKTGEEFENILPEHVGYDGETWNGADGKPVAFEVIAWMPLPEPYKEHIDVVMSKIKNAER